MRGGAFAQFFFGFRQRDVQRALALPGAFDQELQRDGGLARSGRAFQQEDMAARQAARQNFIQAGDAGFRADLRGSVR
jgi:hypothetical protein